MPRAATGKNIFLLGVLTVAAGASWYLANSLQTPEITRTISSGESDGFYLRFARILGTDEQGNLLYSIEADYAEQQPDEQIELQNVRIEYSALADVPWSINADLALISNDQTHVLLSGNVSAKSNEGFAGEVTEIRAPIMEIDPNSYKAETDSRVQIRIGSRSLTATGMLALLQDNRLQLKSNVSGKFIP